MDGPFNVVGEGMNEGMDGGRIGVANGWIDIKVNGWVD